MSKPRCERLDRWLHSGTAVAERLAVATIDNGTWSEMTFAELDRRSSDICGRLRRAGARQGDAVALVGPAGGDWTAAFFGILECGAVAVLLDAKLTPEELADLCRRSGLVAAVVAGADAYRWDEATAVWTAGARLPVVDPGDVGDAKSSDSSHERVDVTATDDDPAVLVWTSGTTQAPKGVVLSLANLAYAVEQASVVQQTRPSDRWLSVLPPNHLLELCCGLLPALAAGSTTVVARSAAAPEFPRLVRQCRANRVVVVPSILTMLWRHVSAETGQATLAEPLPEGVAFYCGGAALDPEVAEFFTSLGISVYTGYGLTEAGPTVSMNTPAHQRAASVGRPLPGTEVRIARDGEILVRSPGVMLGYRDDDVATREAVDAEGWLRTGDLGRLDDDGYLHVTGRAKSLIVLDNGKKVQPEEVEAALARSELFDEACVLGWQGGETEGEPRSTATARRREQVCAVVVPTASFAAMYEDRPRLEVAARDEVHRLTAALSKFKRPTLVRVHHGDLPKSPKRSVRQAEVRRYLEQRS